MAYLAAIDIGQITVIGKKLLGLFGGGRGDYQKYEREVAPQLVAKAKTVGAPVFCAWFGEIVGSDRDGSRIVLGKYATIAEAEKMMDDAAAKGGGQIWALWNGVYRTFGSTAAASSSSGGLLMLGGLALALLRR